MENLMEEENSPIKSFVMKESFKKECSTEREWSFTNPDKLLKEFSNKIVFIKGPINM